jgi:hypothetical protein
MITYKQRTQEGFMRTRMQLGIIPLFAIWIVGTAHAGYQQPDFGTNREARDCR